METDLEKIKKLSKQKEYENIEFRSFLKFTDDPDKIDDIVHDLFKNISSQIDCTTCANCCKATEPLLKGKDINNLAKHLNIAKNKFIKDYLKKN